MPDMRSSLRSRRIHPLLLGACLLLLCSPGFTNAAPALSSSWRRIRAGDLENTVVEHHHSEQSESDAGGDQNFIHVVDAKAACLFDPVLDERIAQSVLGFRLGKIRAFDDETIFAHFFGLFE